MLQAYTKGVNAYIASLSYKNLPIEYKLLDYHPEPWTPFKSALLQVYMTDRLSGSDADLENTNALQRLGREKSLIFFIQINFPTLFLLFLGIQLGILALFLFILLP